MFGHRLHLVVGDALAIRLPATPSAVANPPMVPGEFCFAVGSPGRERLFTHVLVERLADAGVRDIWLHQFDYLGMDIAYGPGPTLVRAGTALGFEVSFPHRGWRALGPGSAVRRALPALGRLYPDAPVLLGEALVPLALVPATTTASLAIRHSIVRLHRPASTQGVLQ